MKVVFYQKVNSLWRELLEPVRKELPDLELITDYEQADQHIADAEVIVGGKISREVFERAEKLQLVIVPFTGVNHLPFDLLQEKGVRVANSHGNAFYVAEKTVGLILAYYGRVIEFHNDMRRTKWHGFWVGKGLNDSWESIDGKSAAILGTGEIGKYTAGLLKAFRVRTIGYKRTKVETLPEGFDEMVYSIDEAIEKADIIVVALPATDATRGLIGEQQLQHMQEKLLVNIGRGSIVDEAALYEALRAGTLGGAAIDCWYTYPKEGVMGAPSNYPIHELDNVILSPHIGGFTTQAARKGIEQACENLRRFASDGSLLFEADISAGY